MSTVDASARRKNHPKTGLGDDEGEISIGLQPNDITNRCDIALTERFDAADVGA